MNSADLGLKSRPASLLDLIQVKFRQKIDGVLCFAAKNPGPVDSNSSSKIARRTQIYAESAEANNVFYRSYTITFKKT